MRLVGVPADMMQGTLPLIRDRLAECTERGRYTVEELVQGIMDRDRQCWIVMDGRDIKAVALTQIGGDSLKTCRITHLAGDGLQDWKDAYQGIREWAKGLGSKRIEALARPGYERIGKKYGLKKTHVLLEEDL